jgi:hypothetical protein
LFAFEDTPFLSFLTTPSRKMRDTTKISNLSSLLAGVFTMAKAEVHAGICGFHTVIETSMDGEVCKISIQSECSAIQRMGQDLVEVDPYQEISFRRKMPLTMDMAVKYCKHAACPVPVGIIKAVEVESNLALPADVSIKVSRA